MDVPTSHRDLAAWQAAIALATKVYEGAPALPSAEPWDIGSQLKRTAAVIPSQIAEGASRTKRQEFMAALRRARGLLAELETHVIIAGHQGLLSQHDALLQDIVLLNRSLSELLRRLSERRCEDPYRPPAGKVTDARRPRPL